MRSPLRETCNRCGTERPVNPGLCAHCGHDQFTPLPLRRLLSRWFANLSAGSAASKRTPQDIPQPPFTTPSPEPAGIVEPMLRQRGVFPDSTNVAGSESVGIQHNQPVRLRYLLLSAGLLAILAGQLSLLGSDLPRLPASSAILFLMGIGLVASCGLLPESRVWLVNRRRLAGPTVSLALALVLLTRFIWDIGTQWDILVWVLSIAAFGAVFMPERAIARIWNTATVASESLHSLAKEYCGSRVRHHFPLVIIITVYCAVAIPNLTAWRYSFIGDEYAFYQQAAYILEDGVTNAFSQNGVYDKNPQLNTIYKAAVMWAFGDGHFGWKMSGVATMIMMITGLYALGYALGGRAVAITAAASLAASHYLLGLMNGGYNHLEGLLIPVWAITLFVLGLRRQNPLLLYLAGAVVGLGFYFHYSARIVGPIMLLLALVSVRPRQYLALWPVLAGFMLAAWPTFLLAQEEIFTKMLAQSVGFYSQEVSGRPLARIINNLAVNLPAFHYSSAIHTYTSGSLLDPVSGTLALLGIGFSVSSPTRMASKLCLIWLAVAFVATGLISPYPTTAITRIFPMMPPLVLLAGIAVSRLWAQSGLSPRRFLPDNLAIAVPGTALTILLAVVLLLNLNQAWTATHRVYHYPLEALAIGAMHYQDCEGKAAERIMFVGLPPGSVLATAISSYYPDIQPSQLRIYEDWQPDALLPAPLPHCVVLLFPHTPEGQALKAGLQIRYPSGEFYTLTTPSQKSAVEYFYLEDAAPPN